MQKIENKHYDEERALYNMEHLHLLDCAFTGPADGESAVKECTDVLAERCFCNLRYPFWHVHQLRLLGCELTENARAALWYSDHVEIVDTKLHGIKALRECHNASLYDCDIKSDEFGWFSREVCLKNCTAEGSYFMLHAANLDFSDMNFKGKYALQYLQNCRFERCRIASRDAFWHAKDVTIKNSVLGGEFLGWYSDGLTLENCRIISSQPLCYCKHLTLINCELVDSELCFEKSEVEATITTPVDSIKNPRSGRILVPEVGEIIRDDKLSTAEIILTKEPAKLAG